MIEIVTARAVVEAPDLAIWEALAATNFRRRHSGTPSELRSGSWGAGARLGQAR